MTILLLQCHFMMAKMKTLHSRPVRSHAIVITVNYKGAKNKQSVRPPAIAQWIRLHLPSYGHGFESQAHPPYTLLVNFCIIFVIVLRKGRR